MKKEEEYLQESTEEGKGLAESPEAFAYQQVFSVLKHDEEFKLSPDFYGRVIQKIVAQQEKKSSSKAFWWMAAGILVFVIGSVVALINTGFKPGFGSLTFISDYGGLLLFGMAFVALLHWVEKRFLRIGPV